MCEPKGRIVGHLVLQDELPFELAQQVAPISEQAAGQQAREKAPMQWHDTLPSLSETRSEAFGLESLDKDQDLPSFHARSFQSEGLKTAKTTPSSYSGDLTRYRKALFHYVRDDHAMKKRLEAAGFPGQFDDIYHALDPDVRRTFDLPDHHHLIPWIGMRASDICRLPTEEARRERLEKYFREWNMMRTASSTNTASLLVRRFYVNHDNLGTKNPVHIGRVWKDVKDWQFRTRQTLLGLKFLRRRLPRALKGSLFVRIMDYSMDPQPAMGLPGTRLEQNDYQFDRDLNRNNRVRLATSDLEKESVKFLEATYLLTRKWFGFDITRDDLTAQIQALKPAITHLKPAITHHL